MPTAAKLMINDDPPAETNGNGMPVTGIRPTTLIGIPINSTHHATSESLMRSR